MQARICASCGESFTDPASWLDHFCPNFHDDGERTPGVCELSGCNARLMGMRRDARYCTDAHAREARRGREFEQRCQRLRDGIRGLYAPASPGSVDVRRAA